MNRLMELELRGVDCGTGIAGGGAVKSSLLTGLTAYWKMDEVSAGAGAVPRLDSSGNGNTLTDNGTMASTVGLINNGALGVRVDSTYLSIVNNASVQMGDFDLELTGWINFTTKATSMYIINKYFNSAQRSLLFWFISGTGFQMLWATNGVGGNVNKVFTAEVDPATGAWIFFDIYHDSVNNLIGCAFNNGVFETTSTGGGGNPGNDDLCIMGAPAGNDFNGVGDEFGYWKRLLTPAERTALYNGGAGKTYPF